MEHNEYKSVLLEQIRNSVKDVNTIAEGEPYELFEKCVPRDEAKKASNVFITGCGDSYCAGIAAKPVYENAETSTRTGMVPGTPTNAMRIIDFSRYLYTYSRWEPLTEQNNLLCVISISGSPSRVNEAAKRINEHNGISVGFTCNPEGKLAKNCKYYIPMTLPDYDVAPNVTSYYASLYSLMMFGLYISEVKGQISKSDVETCQKDLLEYVNSYTDEVMNTISKQAYDLSVAWENDGVDNMDFVGDGPDYATAFFGSAKMVEAFGGLTTNDDSEQWCHINFFIKDTDHIGTFIVANSDSPAFSREVETVELACKVRKHVCVITDADKSLFPESAVVIQVPKAKKLWMHPLMEHIPMDFVAGYIGCFRGLNPFRINEQPQCNDPNQDRFRNSKIEII